jgi:type I restriction enzyme, R subunit
MIPGKDAPFVLDFRNEAEEIYSAFKPYYDVTKLVKRSEPAELERLKHELDEAQVYHWSEVEAFARIFYRPLDMQNPADHAHMQRHLQPAIDRFKELDEESRDTFREKLNAYVRTYAFLSQIIPWADQDMEMLYSFGRCLKMPDGTSGFVKITDEVDLEYYRLERIFSGAIDLGQGTAEGVKSPTEVGTSRVKDAPAPLSEIIDVVNQRFGTEFNEEDRLFLQQIKEKACSDVRVVQTALANPLDKFRIGIRKFMEDFMVQRMAENDAIVTRYMADDAFQSTVFGGLAREIFESVHKRERELSERP